MADEDLANLVVAQPSLRILDVLDMVPANVPGVIRFGSIA